MMYVRIRYAVEPGFRFTEEIDQRRDIVWEGEVALAGDDVLVLEQLFSMFNRHDAADQHPALDDLGLRSLSVGDVIEFVEPGNGRFYLCASFGWNPIEGVRA